MIDQQPATDSAQPEDATATDAAPVPEHGAVQHLESRIRYDSVCPTHRPGDA
ncbi:hypothetical protein ACFVWR_10150 [Leifsonia sp. NPDC058292]|uniref:hypothetical protein n=1 Tax=Leifsonia sp. NPDC058292 TaxID=3346428 RepID=UPI0036DE9518